MCLLGKKYGRSGCLFLSSLGEELSIQHPSPGRWVGGLFNSFLRKALCRIHPQRQEMSEDLESLRGRWWRDLGGQRAGGGTKGFKGPASNSDPSIHVGSGHFSLSCLSQCRFSCCTQDRRSLGISLLLCPQGYLSPGPSPASGWAGTGGTLALSQAALALSITRLTKFPNELNHATLLHGPNLQFPLINDCKLLSSKPLGAAIINGWE